MILALYREIYNYKLNIYKKVRIEKVLMITFSINNSIKTENLNKMCNIFKENKFLKGRIIAFYLSQ